MLETLDYKIPMTTKAPLPVISVRGAGRGVGTLVRRGHCFLAQVAAGGREKIEIQPSHRPRSQKSIPWQPGIGSTNEHSQCLAQTVCMLHAPLQLEMCVIDAVVG